ncbi:HAMP domain-containing histidine kinase [Mucilaginibacter sp. UR6-1]|uniref:sensor histidine kinase n=1 Tax=Mucilaginibacter sp. UR6-1 TaxID=1435643 RepID=UPI001E31F8FF|nr:HAMP domain-containing sensor histidine kinase [Mucilaginibacter sp. UR6-1]MCC8409664.1 HAMP domain-containing histidine kinase [Mucilaginibacter sp. UR6-1]
MKLNTKLTLFNTISKLVIVVLFVLLLPLLITKINLGYTDSKLIEQKEKVLQIVKTLGIGNYITDGESYGSYTLLKEEYISLDEVAADEYLDTILNERRIVEGDTIEYRILSHTFKVNKKNYLLEVGKSVSTLDDTSGPLQNIAFQVLVSMILLTILADQVYSNYVLRPLRQIIRTKLNSSRFPYTDSYRKVRTSTADFQYLDISIHRMMETITDKFQKEREFISNASHELMTPISILQTKIENMFVEEDIADDLKVRLLEMQRILNRLKSITKTLLLISQIENEQFLKEDEVNLNEMLHDVQDEISIRLEQKEITCNINVPADVALQKVNKFLLFNLLFNLINNAIKYNHEGGSINITAQKNTANLILNIADTGIGIAADELPYIFNRFKKLKRSLQQDSFGLGLPIVKSIADFHRIQIEVSSEKDKGSVFSLIIPAAILKG